MFTVDVLQQLHNPGHFIPQLWSIYTLFLVDLYPTLGHFVPWSYLVIDAHNHNHIYWIVLPISFTQLLCMHAEKFFVGVLSCMYQLTIECV